ncbi:MAG: DNA-binding response regulator, partial [Pseudonocardiaceae bacterium]
MRVVLAEDSLLLREGLVRLLAEAGAEVVAAVGNGAALEIRRQVPGTAILVLSQYVGESYAADLLTAGGGVG